MPETLKHFFRFFCFGAAAGFCILTALLSSVYLLRLYRSSWHKVRGGGRLSAGKRYGKSAVHRLAGSHRKLPGRRWLALVSQNAP